MHLANFFGIQHADTDAQTIAQARAQGNRRRARRGLCYTWHRHVGEVSMPHRWRIDGMSSMSMPTSMQRNSMYAIATHGIRCTTSLPSP